MTTISYDWRCAELASVFLSDEPGIETWTAEKFEAQKHELAQHIQETVESWLDSKRIRAATSNINNGLCSDCPPAGYPTEKTRCESCPRKSTPGPDEGGRQTVSGDGGKAEKAPKLAAPQPMRQCNGTPIFASVMGLAI